MARRKSAHSGDAEAALEIIQNKPTQHTLNISFIDYSSMVSNPAAVQPGPRRPTRLSTRLYASPRPHKQAPEDNCTAVATGSGHRLPIAELAENDLFIGKRAIATICPCRHRDGLPESTDDHAP
nr:hypothetical protein FFPRI1PSEUD_63900 [Pseudomonas sp. FFPRI_1]